MLIEKLARVYVQLCGLCDAGSPCRLTWAELAERVPESTPAPEACLSALADFGVVKCLETDADGASFHLLRLNSGYWPRPRLQ